MSLFHKIFGTTQKAQGKTRVQHLSSQLPSDRLFVERFNQKGGKFLYTDQQEEISKYLKNIFAENAWESAFCFDKNLLKKLTAIDISQDKNATVFFTGCEHLIVDDGSILFSSHQLKETKLPQYPRHFIVYATTSQLVQSRGEALSSIQRRFGKAIPSNISAIKSYTPPKNTDFLDYGNLNSKNLYLLLFEDL